MRAARSRATSRYRRRHARRPQSRSCAIVTGAASGIGKATVERLRTDGWRVAGIDRDIDQLGLVTLDATAAADTSDPIEITAAVDLVVSVLGRLDAVVACAGIAAAARSPYPPAEWERIIAVNVTGVYLTGRAAIPHLRRSGGGSIVNIASQLGLVAAPNAAAYCASKGAVVQLTRAMAIDHGPEGIRVNCVCPGPTDTPLLEPYFAASHDPAAERRRYEQAQAHGRLVTPQEVADAIAYLCSPGAASTIGAALVVDGGYSIV